MWIRYGYVLWAQPCPFLPSWLFMMQFCAASLPFAKNHKEYEVMALIETKMTTSKIACRFLYWYFTISNNFPLSFFKVRNLQRVKDQANNSVLISTGSGSIPYVKRSAIRIAMAVWLLSLVVLQNGYNGVLTSFMTVPKLEPVFNTLEEVLADGRYRITDQKHSVMTNQFLVLFF